jgi:hypothetical protein
MMALGKETGQGMAIEVTTRTIGAMEDPERGRNGTTPTRILLEGAERGEIPMNGETAEIRTTREGSLEEGPYQRSLIGLIKRTIGIEGGIGIEAGIEKEGGIEVIQTVQEVAVLNIAMTIDQDLKMKQNPQDHHQGHLKKDLRLPRNHHLCQKNLRFSLDLSLILPLRQPRKLSSNLRLSLIRIISLKISEETRETIKIETRQGSMTKTP